MNSGPPPQTATSPESSIPLAYEDPATAAWQALFTLTRGLTLFVIFRQSIGLLQYAIGVACYFWNAATMPPAMRILVPGPILFFELPDILVAIVVAAVAFGCLGFNENARRLMVRAMKIQLFTGPASLLATAIYYESTRSIAQYGMAYEAHTLIRYLISAIFLTGITVATILFFQHASIRKTFHTENETAATAGC